MSLEEAIRRFNPSQKLELDLLIWEARAEMPCYTAHYSKARCLELTLAKAHTCPSGEARAALKVLKVPA